MYLKLTFYCIYLYRNMLSLHKMVHENLHSYEYQDYSADEFRTQSAGYCTSATHAEHASDHTEKERYCAYDGQRDSQLRAS